jgi:hypothetical protein
MPENNGNAPKKEVNICVDETGNIRTAATPGMNYLEVITMPQISLETVEKKAVEGGKVIIPREPNLVNLKTRGN